MANIASKDPDQIRAGNERVIRPRLEDAVFFWNQDRKHSLESRAAQLDNVTFQEKPLHPGAVADQMAQHHAAVVVGIEVDHPDVALAVDVGEPRHVGIGQ